MSSRKNRPVMYEVLRRTNGATTTTTWKRTPAPSATESDQSDDPIRVDRPRPSASGPGLRETFKRWAQLPAGRVHLSLTYPLLAFVAVGVIVLVWLAFATGRRVGERNTVQSVAQRESDSDRSVGGVLGLANELGKSRPANPPPAAKPESKKELAKAPEKPKETPKTPPEKLLTAEKQKTSSTQIVANPGAEPSSEVQTKKEEKDSKRPKDNSKISSEVEKTYQVEPNKHYIQVQCFRKGREDDARNAAEFLTQNGIPTMILPRPSDTVVYVREPFTIKGADAATAKSEKARAEDLKKRVKAVGLLYTKQGGRYDFKLADLEIPSR